MKDTYWLENVSKISGIPAKDHCYCGGVDRKGRVQQRPLLDGYHPAHRRCGQRQVNCKPPDAHR